MRILIASQDWDYRFARPQQLALIFREQHEITYVATAPGIRTRSRDVRRGGIPLRLPGFQPAPNIRAFCALYLRDAASAGEQRRNQQASAARLKAMFPEAFREIDLAVITNPLEYDFLQLLVPGTGPRLPGSGSPATKPRVVYDCLDRYEDFYPEGSDLRALLLEREAELMARADWVFASSRLLAEDKSGIRPTLYLPHGVDVERFEQESRNVPADLAALRRPIVGFLGAIEVWLALDWVRAAAERLTGVTFAMIGDVRCDLQGLDRLPNVRFLGYRPYRAVPSCMAGFDVCTIPFRINRLTAAVNPVKALEYFALGKPVVSSYMPELERYVPHISLVRTAGEFVSALESSLAGDAPGEPEARRRIARSRSWRALAEAFLRVVEGKADDTGF